jgi:hypothetical protein
MAFLWFAADAATPPKQLAYEKAHRRPVTLGSVAKVVALLLIALVAFAAYWPRGIHGADPDAFYHRDR